MRRERRALGGLVACAALVWGCFPGDGVRGTPLAYQDCGDGTVVDLVTNLMWEQKVEGGDETTCLTALHGVYSRCSWSQASMEWIVAVNAEEYAGYSDWRLPHVKELQSIMDYSQAYPAIQPIFGPTDPWNQGVTWSYWSTTWDAGSADWQWTVELNGGGVNTTPTSTTPDRAVRAVRDGPCP